MDAAQLLFIVGAVPFVLGGATHAALSLHDALSPNFLTSLQRNVAGAMERANLALYPPVKDVRAWVGFTVSHGLGLLIFGLFVLLLAALEYDAYRGSNVLMPLTVAVGLAYVGLSIGFWSRRPLAATAFGTACFAVGWVLALT